MDYFEYAVKTADKKYNDNMHKSLTKMHKFLIDKGIASSFKEVKELPRIEIIGTDDNGRERLIMKDLIESQDINVLESSVGYNTYYPAKKCGVIKSTTKTNGNYYTVFTVTSGLLSLTGTSVNLPAGFVTYEPKISANFSLPMSFSKAVRVISDLL